MPVRGASSHLFPLNASAVCVNYSRGKVKELEEAPISKVTIVNDRASKLVKLFATDQSGFELEDLKGFYIEFSKDQHGSRFLQKELEVVDSDMVHQVFEEVLPVARSLMVDVYGNYVIQKFFDFGTDEQRFLLASKLRGNVVALSLHLYGCRVIQKGLETLSCYLQVIVCVWWWGVCGFTH